MTVADYLVHFSMPIGGLVIGAILLLQSRSDNARFDAKYGRKPGTAQDGDSTLQEP